jgi:UDP-glucose 4-epimerase
MIKDSYLHGKIYIEGNGLQTRDFLHVDDLSKAIIKILKKKKNIEGIFQLATSKEVSILSLAKMIQKIFLVYKDKVVDIKFIKARIGDVKRSYSSINKIKNHLDWKPLEKINEKHLKKLLEYYESRK